MFPWMRHRSKGRSPGRVTALGVGDSDASPLRANESSFMPKRRGSRSALRAAADTLNPNPPAAQPRPGWLTRIMDWIGRVRDASELEAVIRHLEYLIQFARDRLRELNDRAHEPAPSLPRQD